MFSSTNLSQLVKVKETEKAVAVKGWKNYIGSSKSWEVDVWIPKSIIVDDVIPAWFVRKTEQSWKLDDVNVVLEIA